MEFFLPFQIQSYPFTISYRDAILFMGSCFSEEIGNKMKDLKFNVLQNPNGILYDPLSVCDSLFSYIANKSFEAEDLFELNGLWHSWKHHSRFSGINKKEVLDKINESRCAAHQFLAHAKFLIITLGTAFNYQLKEQRLNVANCHKAPAIFFEKTLLPTGQIISTFSNTLAALEKMNPGLKIIFTISPVKYVRDGVIENSRSKARLIEAVQSIVEQKQNVFYFPSYELVTDVLRDYRFYKNDLVHPNEAAVNFVFEKFGESFFDNSSKQIMEEIKKVLNAVNHKPFSKESVAHKKFLTGQLSNIQRIEELYPFINLSDEKSYFEDQQPAN